MIVNNKNNYFDVHLHTEPYYAVSFRTGLTVYEESLINGIYVSSGWNGSGYPFSVTSPLEYTRLNPLDFSMPQAFIVGIDGQFLGSHWLWENFEKVEEDKGLHVKVRLKHQVRPINITIHTFLDGTPIIMRWLEIHNISDHIVSLNELAPMSGGMQTTKRWANHLINDKDLYSLGYMENTHWGHEGNFQWHSLPNAGYSVHGRFRRDRYRHPMFVLENKATGEHFICQFGWSGGYTFEFDLDTESIDANLAYKVNIDAPAPLRTLSPNEIVMSPKVHMGMLFGGLDDSINAMHAHLRKTVFLPQARDMSGWVQSGIGPEMEMNEEVTLRLIDDAAYYGAEVFYIDAGWYVPPNCETEWWDRVGDWHADNDRYTKNLKTIRDRVKQHGMLFGLWMDAERIGSMSNIFKEHPEWVVTTYDNKKAKSNLLDLTNPEAAKWMENEISRVIEEYELDFYRLDYNVGTFDVFSYTKREGYIESNVLRYHEKLYEIYDRLRTKYPDVIFENCAGGGGRTDVGMVSRFCHTWVTDWQIAPRSFSITNGMTMALPPEKVNRLIAGQNGHTTSSLGFQTRLLLFVQPTFGCTFYPDGYTITDHKWNLLSIQSISIKILLDHL
ncbi:MAG: alpha-galactosidase [Clostridia bacterium]|nr:alpha-galactosidase [Clostridia bacterium]